MRSHVMRRVVLVVALTVAALSLATCISAEEHDYVTYDAGKDQFQMLMVLTDIRGKDADDLGYMQAIYNNRDHLIAPVLPGGGNILALVSTSLLRLSDKQVSPLNIFSSRPSEVEALDTAVPLASIEIHPGTFFVENKKLGFYQSVTVPGSAIDAALLEISKALQTDDLAKSIQTEIDRRAAGGKTLTWAQVSAYTLKQMTITPASQPAVPETPATGPATTQAADDIEPQYALEMDSLKALQKAVTDKSLRIVRSKQTVSLMLPVTAKDAAGVADLYKAALGRAQDLVKTTKETPEVADSLRDARMALQVSTALSVSADDKGVTATVDLLTLAKAMAALPAKRIDNNNKQGDDNKEGPDAVAFMRDQKVPLNETLTADQIVRNFNAGTLKAYPSDKPVKPGEGIVAPKP